VSTAQSSPYCARGERRRRNQGPSSLAAAVPWLEDCLTSSSRESGKGETMSDQIGNRVVSLILKNSRVSTAAMALRLSPSRASFSGDYTMEPGELYRLRAWGASPGELSIELVDHGFIVRDWPHSVVCVSSVKTLGGLPRSRSQIRIAPAISIRERFHPLDEDDEDTKPGA
jgi:hypothetical protein